MRRRTADKRRSRDCCDVRFRIGGGLLYRVCRTFVSRLTRVRRRVCCAHQLLMFALVAVVVFLPCGLSVLFRALRATHFLAVARNAGPAKSKQKRLAPTLALRCAPGPLATSLLRGSACRAIHGPTPFAAPAAQPPYTTTPLGLAVNGAGRSQARSKAPLPSPLPQAGEGADRVGWWPFVPPRPLAGEGPGERGF